METKYGTLNNQHNLQPRKPRNYGHMHATLESIFMTQHSVKKGLKVFGEASTQAVLEEQQQCHDHKAMEPIQKAQAISQERNGTTLYGTLQAAVLFWKKLSKRLKAWGFTINPYDWCVEPTKISM
jgi:hypothetical protein